MNIQVGTKLRLDGLEGKVIGLIEYENRMDHGNRWTEYRVSTKKGERWLSVDEVYKEYSVSWAANDVRGNIGPEWHKVDEGTQVVVSAVGDVDVERGDFARFVEFEDSTEELTLSVEIWDDGTEYSKGEYLDLEEIEIIGYEKPKSGAPGCGFALIAYAFIFILVGIISTVGAALNKKTIAKFVSKSSLYEYVTSITGNEKQKADVYEYFITTTTDTVAKSIIDGIEGDTESVTQKDEVEDSEIAIVTDKEYCLIYHPEDNAEKVYVQVSKRKYNYTSDNAPYKSSDSDTTWYRSHYYSSSYSADSSTYHSPSAYTSYSGDTVHNIGNGYFDSYSSSVRQSSINSRNSSSGGVSIGK